LSETTVFPRYFGYLIFFDVTRSELMAITKFLSSPENPPTVRIYVNKYPEKCLFKG